MDRNAVNIALTGYRATGKSTVGAEIARRLSCPHIDTDAEIQRRAGRSIREIFEQQGERGFRDLESEVLSDCCSRPRVVISLGGGAVLREQNRQLLRAHSATVWLRVKSREIWRRLQADEATAEQRPALTKLTGYAEVAAVLKQRNPIYQEVADLILDADNKTVPHVAEVIVSLLMLHELDHLPEVQTWIAESHEA